MIILDKKAVSCLVFFLGKKDAKSTLLQQKTILSKFRLGDVTVLGGGGQGICDGSTKALVKTRDEVRRGA